MKLKQIIINSQSYTSQHTHSTMFEVGIGNIIFNNVHISFEVSLATIQLLVTSAIWVIIYALKIF